MFDSTAHMLLPQEQLDLISHHERQELQRYRRLALSLLPTAPHISRLMATLGTECELRLETLRTVASELDLEACLGEANPAMGSALAPSCRHFFVVNGTMTSDVLDEALEAAHHSWHFYDALLATNATPELYRPLQAFVRQKRREYQLLEERHGEWQLEARLPRER
ncbi:hypothetical protein EQG41_08200 [Billgrantia azerbaijanica]|nr:hypothetical protein EQG41_08200 [Halomonas azerbaijanica]